MRALLLLITAALLAASLSNGATTCTPPSFPDSHGACFDFTARLTKWKHDHPSGIGPERLGKTISSLMTTGAAPCRGVVTSKRKWANFIPTWSQYGSRVQQCVEYPIDYPATPLPWTPPFAYPPDGIPPDPDTVWGLHKRMAVGDGQFVTVNYLINCDAELFFGQCAQNYSNRFNCTLDMGDPEQLMEYTHWAATEQYPAGSGPSCVPSPLLRDSFENGLQPWWVGNAPSPTPTPVPTPTPLPTPVPTPTNPCPPGQCMTMTGCQPGPC